MQQSQPMAVGDRDEPALQVMNQIARLRPWPLHYALEYLLSLDARKKSLQLAEKIYETSRIKFKEGVGSSLETTSAERDLYQSQANLMEAQVNLIQAKIDMDKSLGKL